MISYMCDDSSAGLNEVENKRIDTLRRVHAQELTIRYISMHRIIIAYVCV